MFDVREIKDPTFIKKLNIKELNLLANSIRAFLITQLSSTGGHLASNLGVVELTIAMHYVFDSPQDKLLFDVGHQAYVHKILTGRAKDFVDLRKLDGLSGYICREESVHDVWESGHSSTTLSAQAGFIEAKHQERVIALIGDSAIANGVAFEGLNYLGNHPENAPIIILNDNKMGINKSVGALAHQLNSLRGSKSKRDFKLKLIKKMPKCFNRLGHKLYKKFRKQNLFDNLGFDYYGPYEGTDIAGLIKVLKEIKDLKRPAVIHVITRKGQGYLPAERHMTDYHGIDGFNPSTGEIKRNDKMVSFSKIVADSLYEYRQKTDFTIINPAMIAGSALKEFKEKYPEACIDVGIAEEHAVCMAAGMALNGKKVVVSLYSTFAQRAFDQILNDVARTNIPVKFLFDRAGVVGPDGPTHQGIYDLAMLDMMPNMTICMPKDAQEAKGLIEFVLNFNGPIVMRYPKLSVLDGMKKAVLDLKWEVSQKGRKGIIITYGPDVDRIIKLNLDCYVINARFIRPIDKDLLEELVRLNLPILVYEQVVNSGSLGMKICDFLVGKQFNMQKFSKMSFSEDTIVTHGQIDAVLARYNLGDNDIIKEFQRLCD